MKEISTPISPGELLDKLTILQIKCAQITDPQKLANVMAERDLLQAVVTQHIPARDDIAALTTQLQTINQQLWVIEDDLRDLERAGEFGHEFIELARSVYFTNDKRAALKKQVNLALGSLIVEEKSYATY